MKMIWVLALVLLTAAPVTAEEAPSAAPAPAAVEAAAAVPQEAAPPPAAEVPPVPADPAQAVETAAPQADWENIEYTYGTVKEVGADKVVITEYDYEKDQDVDMTYMVGADVQLENIKALSDVAVGHDIEIGYRLEGTDRKVISILDETLLDQEYTQE